MTGIAPKNREEYERLNAPINKRFKSVHEIEKNGRTFGYILLAIELLFLGGCLVGQYINALNNAKNDPTMTWVNGRIAASVGTADSYVSFPILYLFIFRKTLVAKIRIIFSDQAHSSLKKRGFAKIQNNDEPSTPTGV